MRKLLNTLFVNTETAYITLDGENVVIKNGNTTIGRFPLHNLSGIISFSYVGASPALMGECADRNIYISFCTPNGRFLARTSGLKNGNVLLRKAQYRLSDNKEDSCAIARNMIFGKLYNCRWSIERTKRDHRERIDVEKFENASKNLRELGALVSVVTDYDKLLGYEGSGATVYFNVFDDMILRNKDDFVFAGRNRRPPLDNINAMLSFAYSLLANDCASALESVGLDSYVGFLHRDRAGRESLALDLMEELRPCLADRFVITLINNRVLSPEDFKREDSGAVRMTDEGRKRFLKEWQERKKDQITHPFNKEKMSWGMIPYMQSLLLARFLRGDLDAYPPFLWK